MRRFCNIFGSLLVILGIILGCSNSSHFRFVTTSWAPTSQNNVIHIKINLAYRFSYHMFKNVTVNNVVMGFNNHPYSGHDLGIINYGDGTEDVLPLCTVTSVNMKDDFFTCSMNLIKNYPMVQKNYTFTFRGTARLKTLINNHNGSYRAEMSINIVPPPDVTYPSPVSGVLPIINVIKGVSNSFRLVAWNAPQISATNPLRYWLATGAQMGDYYQVQPKKLFVNNHTGWVTFAPERVGLYTTQIVISNGINYIVVDFILNSILPPNSPPFYFGDTPVNGEEIIIQVKETKKWAYQAMSNLTTVGVIMYSANQPVGVSCSKQQGTNPGLINCSWTPSVEDVGTYVVSLSVSDTVSSKMSGLRSFIVTVQSPECGNGNLIPNCFGSNCCKCDGNWDPSFNCLDCVPGHFGAKCTKNPDCFNGTISDGVNGNGVCTCYFGYTGPACNVTVSQFCQSAKQTTVKAFNNGVGYLGPKNMLVYVSQTSPAFILPLTLSIPAILPSIDIYVLLDVATTTNIANLIQSHISTFVSTVKTYSEDIRLGLGVFSDAPGGFNYTNMLVLGSTITTTVSNYKFTIMPTRASTHNGLGALFQASQSAIGWNNHAYRSLLLITDSDCEGPSEYYKKVGQSLIENSVMPSILGVGRVTMTNWKQFLKTITFGVHDVSSSTSVDWTTRAYRIVKNSFKQVAPFTFDNADGFITNTIAPYTTTSPMTISVPFNVSMPAGIIQRSQSSASVSVPGYGISHIAFTFNHQPVAVAGMLTTTKNVNQTFKFLVSDADSNLMTINFISLPNSSIGTVTSNGVAVNLTTSYFSTSNFVFTPELGIFNKNTSFGYSVSDGCVSVNSTFRIRVNDDYSGTPPIALSTLVNTSVNAAVRFSFNYSDTNKTTAKVMLGSLPVNGNFTFVNGMPITSSMIGEPIPPTIIYTPKTGMTNDDTVDGMGPLDTAYFSVLNDKGYISAVEAVASIFVKPFHPPTYTGQLVFNTLENTPLTFLLTGKVGARQAYYTVVFDSVIGRGNLSYMMCAEVDMCYKKIESTPFKSNIVKPGANTQLLYVPVRGDYQDKIMTIKLRLVSPNGDSTASITIYINVIHVPKPPRIVLEQKQIVGSEVVRALTPTVTMTVNESVILTWSSYNYDTPNETLICMIQYTVRRGSLYKYDSSADDGVTGTLITSGMNLGVPTNDTWKVVYKPVRGTSGQSYSKFTFVTMSTLQLLSPSASIVFNVNPVFHPPVITANKLNWTSLVSQALIVTNMSFVSVDVSYQNMTMNISLTDVDGNVPTVGTVSIELLGTTDGYCTGSGSSSVSCLAGKNQLNSMLSQVTIVFKVTGTFQLNVYVENTHLSRVAGLTKEQISDSKSLSIGMFADGSRPTTNTTVLSAAIASAVAAAGLIAVALWRQVRTLSPPTSAFFDDSPFSDGAIQSNPIYTESANAGTNPLYQS